MMGSLKSNAFGFFLLTSFSSINLFSLEQPQIAQNYPPPDGNYYYSPYSRDSRRDDRKGGTTIEIQPAPPAYPYPPYLMNPNPFPDKSRFESIYRENQRRGR